MTPAPQGHERLRSALRIAVALAALLIFAGDTSEHPERRPYAYAVLVAFLAYALVLYAVGVRRSRYIPSIAAAWIDLAWVTLLVAVSEGTSSIFFPLYLFPVLHASFGQGFRAGIAISIGAVASFAIVGATTAPRTADIELSAFVSRPLYLLLLGTVIAAWGDHEVRTRARLALLRDVTSLSNPRFGVDRTVGRFLDAVRRFYRADDCRLVVKQEDGPCWMHASSGDAAASGEATSVPADLARVLLPDLPPLVLRAARERPWARAAAPAVETAEGAGATASAAARDQAASLAAALDAGALLSVPFRYHATATGRLHVSRRRERPFDRSDLDFVRHLLDQVVPVLENLRLVDRLASDAADEERRRIARDLHDSVIQPYLGLRLGLAAAQSALAAGRADEGAALVGRLVRLADEEIQTLRGYVRGLRSGEAPPAGGLLDEGVRRFSSRFQAATGIRVAVTIEGDGLRSDRLSAEVFQMIAEALSNVRRHTSAGAASIHIASDGARLHVIVANDAPPGAPAFFPRSIGERAEALGGTVRVEQPQSGATAVHIEIPL